MSDEDQRCENCRFSGTIAWDERLRCRLEPPKVMECGATWWPKVCAEDWCGKYERKD